MKFNPKLKSDISRYIGQIILAEGKKDEEILRKVGFSNIILIHEDGVSLSDRMKSISKLIPKKEKVCVLTDFDKKGKMLYFKIKELCNENGIKTDSTLRGLILLTGILKIKELDSMMGKIKKS